MPNLLSYFCLNFTFNIGHWVPLIWDNHNYIDSIPIFEADASLDCFPIKIGSVARPISFIVPYRSCIKSVNFNSYGPWKLSDRVKANWSLNSTQDFHFLTGVKSISVSLNCENAREILTFTCAQLI